MIRLLSSKLEEIAKTELNEDHSRTEKDLKHIEEWLEKQPHLKVRKDRQYLLNFLRSSKFSLQRTKEKIDYFYSVKSVIPEFTGKDPIQPQLELIIREGIFVPVTNTASNEPFPTVCIINYKKTNPETMPFIDMFKIMLMYFDILLKEDDNFSVCGFHLVFDMKDFPLSYLKQVTLSVCKRISTCIQKAYPYRTKGFIFINAPKIYEVFINMFLPLASEKNKKRLMIINEQEMDKLYDVIPKQFLPKDYGGEAQCLDELTVEWHKRLINNREWFLEEDQYCSDESKRVGKSLGSVDISGLDGSFRTLNVD